MSDNQNDAFLFVDASTSEADKSYGNKPTYPYVFPAWEWMLERVIRRDLLLTSLTSDSGLKLLKTGMKKYAMHRWPAAGSKGGTPSGCTYFDEACHDGNLTLSGSSNTETIRSLIDRISGLLSDSRFLAPNWLPPENFSKSIVNTWTTTCQRVLEWTSRVSVEEFELPSAPFFRLLTDIRADDALVNVSVPGPDGTTRSVRIGKTRPTLKESDLPTYGGVKCLKTGYYGVNADGALAFPTDDDQTDYSGTTYTGVAAFKHLPNNPFYYPGVIHGPIRRTRGSAIYTGGVSGTDYLQPDVDWDGEPTWWHANGFPKGMDSIVSDTLRRQLTALSVMQPSVPPSLPGITSFPESGAEFTGSSVNDVISFDKWPANLLALAVTPHCVHKMLDAMTKTVMKVPAMFFKIDALVKSHEETRYHHEWSSRKDNETLNSGGTNSHEIVETETTRVGTAVKADGDILGIPGSANDTVSVVDAVTDHTVIEDRTIEKYKDESTGQVKTRTYYDDEEEITTQNITKTTERFTLSKLTALYSSAAVDRTAVSVKVTTDKTTKYANWGLNEQEPAPYTTTEHTEEGEEPGTDSPAESDLLFPGWIRKWIKKAELFLAYDVISNDFGSDYPDGKGAYEETTVNKPDGSKVSGSGTCHTKRKRGVVSLGEMNLQTGTFPDVSLTELREACAPDVPALDPEGYDTYVKSSNVVKNQDSTPSGDGSIVWTDGRITTTEGHTHGVYHSWSSAMFVAIEWDFDTEHPDGRTEPMEEYTAWRDALRRQAAAEEGAQQAAEAKAAAELDVTMCERDLRKAQQALDNIDETQTLYRATAETNVKLIEEDVAAAQQDYTDALAALEQAQESGEGVEEAEAHVNAMAERLAEKQEMLAGAQEYLRRVIEDIAGLLQDALDAAHENLDAAHENLDAAQVALNAAQREQAEARRAAAGAKEAYREAVSNYQGPLR